MGRFLVATAAVLLTAASAAAQSDYPSKPVKIVVNVAPGGGVDTTTRIIADKLHARFGQPFVIENHPGAGGNIGAEVVFGRSATATRCCRRRRRRSPINGSLYKKLNFDPAGFEPVAMMSRIPNVLVVRHGLSRQDRAGIHRLCQSQSGQAQLRLAGDRHGIAPHRRAVHEPHRHQADSRALQGQHVGRAHRPGRRPCRPELHPVFGGVRAATERQGCACSRWRPTNASTCCRTSRPWRRPAYPQVVSETWNAISAPPKTPVAIVGKAQRGDQRRVAGAGRQRRASAIFSCWSAAAARPRPRKFVEDERPCGAR